MKADEFAVSFAHVNVLAAGFGEHGAQFGKSKARQQRDDHADAPNAQE